MAAIMIIAKLLHKTPDTINALAISLTIILLFNPFALLDTGLILSYGGTIGILMFAKHIGKIKNYALKLICVSASAQAILIPIIAFEYCTIHPLFFISSLIGTPLFEIIILLGFAFLLTILPFCNIVKLPLEVSLTLFTKVVNVLSKLPLAQINIAKPNIIEVLIWYLIILLIVIKRVKINKKKAIALCILVILILQIPKYLPTSFKVFFIDVGQGDCTLIQTTNHKNIMIDSGGTENLEEYDVGKKVLVPYLLARGITKLDYIMVSHFHADHCNRIYCSNE